MIAPIRREPIDFMQEIPGTYDFRTGKTKYPQPGPVGGEIESPFDAYLGGLMASHDKPFSKYPPAVGGTDGRYPGLSTDDIKRYLHPSTDPLLNIPITPFGMQAKGGNPFSTDALDKQKQVRDYLDNDQKVRDSLIRRGKIKAGGPSSGDFRLAGLVGFEDWTGPAEHGPIPDIFKTKSINQKGLKSLMEEMREYRRRGVL